MNGINIDDAAQREEGRRRARAERIAEPKELTAANQLRTAADLIDTVVRGLDVRETPCLECGLRNFVNRAQATLYQQLSPTPEKLRVAASRLILAGPADEPPADTNQGGA